jgi:hypothetical protein
LWFLARVTLFLAAAAAFGGCGRLGYDAIEDDASPFQIVDADAAADAAADGAVTIPADAAPGVPDASSTPDAPVNTGACSGPVDCGATSACVTGMCVPAQRVFISAAASGNAAFGGVSAGDNLCQSYADAAQLGGTWKAWLSSSTQHAQSRLVHSTLPYRRLDGVLIANDWTGLTSGTLMNPIDVDEQLVPRPGTEVWTGTSASGFKTMSTCSDWTNGTNLGTVATVGASAATDATWSSVYLQFCDRNNVHLYCVEQ